MLSGPARTAPVQVLLLSGPGGVRKSTLGWEIATQLRRLGIAHVLLDSDEMDRPGRARPGLAGDRADGLGRPGGPVTGRARGNGNVMTGARAGRSATNPAAATEPGMEAAA